MRSGRLFVLFVGLQLGIAACCWSHDGGKHLGQFSKPGAAGDGPFEAAKIELLSHLQLTELGAPPTGVFGNDLWGWTDPQTKREYALFGRSDGTAFVDITDPAQPVYLGDMPSVTGNSVWRDIKVYQNYAYVVSDFNGPHGVQIFDLTRLRGVTSPQTFAHDNRLGAFGGAHNVAINEETGFLYAVGTRRAGGGLYIFDLADPLQPVRRENFFEDGYTHDAQVVVYRGPDPDYAGQEIAFNSNEDTLTIANVTDHDNYPTLVSKTGYGAAYSHQGWLSEDHRYFFMNDELDERNLGASRTRTHVFDVSDLDNPNYVGYHNGTERTIDHNLYVKGDLIYQANYTSGLRVLEIVNPASADLNEIAFLDTYPASNSVTFNGAWSVFPFFESGTVIVSDIQSGLFVTRLDHTDPGNDFDFDGRLDCGDIDALTRAIAAGTNDDYFDVNNDGAVDVTDRNLWLADAGEQNLGHGATYLAGDANLDGLVDGADFLIWNNHKFQDIPAWCSADFNSDGTVDGGDFLEWNNQKFQSSTGSANPVPEPLGCGVLLLALGTLCWRRVTGRLAP